MIPNLMPTSKVSLKMSCLHSCNGDIEKAEKLYKYLSEGLDELPTFDPVRPTTMQQIKDGAVQTFSWINENQDTIMNWVGLIKDMFGKGGGTPSAPASQAIPPIN